MLQISESQYQLLTKDAKLLGGSECKPKVLEINNNLMIKLFHPRKRFTSAKLIPHALRFKKNSIHLQRLGVEAVNVDNILRCPSINADMAIYKKMAGEALREKVDAGDFSILKRLPGFLAKLHDKGVMFRGIHLGNLILRPDDTICLIDYVGLQVKSKPLNLWQRARNLKHLLLDRNDKAIFKDYGYQRFIAEYIAAANLSKTKQRWLNTFINKALKQD